MEKYRRENEPRFPAWGGRGRLGAVEAGAEVADLGGHAFGEIGGGRRDEEVARVDRGQGSDLEHDLSLSQVAPAGEARPR